MPSSQTLTPSCVLPCYGNSKKEQRAGNPDPPSLSVKAIGLEFRKFLVAFIAQFGIALGGDEEFFGFLGEGLHQGVVAHLAHNEVAVLWLRTPSSTIKCRERLTPVRLIGI